VSKGAKRRQQEKEKEIPFGYLPTADPPRKSVPLLLIAAVAFVLWMLVLLYLAFSSR
jgi:hypothetical protein